MAAFSVGDYLAERLAQIGIQHYFLVPGDYNLVVLDKLEAHPELTGIGCANQLNCSLAAGGYARGNGVAACVVTYSVGAFSALINGIGSAYAENLPVIFISGSPNTNNNGQHLLHHSTYQLEMTKKVTCCAVTIRTPKSAPSLIDKAIRAALQQRKPAYIEIPTNLAAEACARPGPITVPVQPAPSDQPALQEAVACANACLETTEKVIMLVGPNVRRIGVGKQLVRLAESIGCSVVVQPAGKGVFPEDHAQFAGVFWGQVSTLEANVMVNWADILLCIGTAFTDCSTVGWTAIPTIPQLILDVDSVTMPQVYFSNVRIQDFCPALAEVVSRNDNTMMEPNRLLTDISVQRPASHEEPLTTKEVSRQLQTLVDSNSVVFADTGDSWFNAIKLLRLPRGAEFEIEIQWANIGWTVPASLGYALAKPEKKIFVMVGGDGAFQVTAQEVSQMVRLQQPIIIILMKNRGYTIEVEIHDGPYNRIHDWDYTLLVQAFNSPHSRGKAMGLKVYTAGQFAEAIARAMLHTNGPTLIECNIDRDDCSRALITWGHAGSCFP